jgi:hypothetical protein
MQASLHAALEPLPDGRSRIWEAIGRDQARIGAAKDALRAGSGNVWIYLETLSVVRRLHEPLRSRHTHQRRLVAQVMELIDIHLTSLVSAAAPETLIAIVSPYGLAPPGSYERFRRLLGFGGTWHASAEANPDGLMVLLGPGVARGVRAPVAQTPDVVPTLCYLLGLPLAQYMDGSVVVEVIKPEFLADHPLRVVD